MSLMTQVDRTRSTLQAANEQLSEARGLLGKPKQEAPKEPEEKGLFDRLKDTVSNVSLSDVGHTVLDVAGLVPVIGAPADGINAVWYAAEGDWVNAGLSATGMIPIAGEAATAAKLGVKATNAVLDTARTADKAADATRASDEVADAANGVETAAGASRSADEAAPPSTSSGSGGDKPPTDNPPPNKGGPNDEDPEDPFDKYKRYGDGDDYRKAREENYGDMGGNQRENRQFDAAQREAERRVGREFDRDERQDRHHRDPHDDGKSRSFRDIVNEFDE